MQVGQHSPTGVKGKWQSTWGQVTSSQTTRPPVQRQVMQGFGDHTAWSNMVRPWYTHWPCLPETKKTPFRVKTSLHRQVRSTADTASYGKNPSEGPDVKNHRYWNQISWSHSLSETWPCLSFSSAPATTDPAAVIVVCISPNLKPVLYHQNWTKQWLGLFPPLFLHWLHLPTWSEGQIQTATGNESVEKTANDYDVAAWGALSLFQLFLICHLS